MGFQLGCEKFGAMTLPLGPRNIDMQIQFMIDFGTTVICATASMALLLAEEINQRNLKDKIKVKKIIFGAERSSVAMTKK